MEAILLAGGKGTRLLPFTRVLPKPLLPLGDAPIAEFILKQLKAAGCSKVYISIGYLGNYIKLYFGDGSKWGIPVEYIEEDQPLGTIGPLSKVSLIGPTLVINGDILCLVDLNDFYQKHIESKADITILSHSKTLSLDFGALTTIGPQVTGIMEKPSFDFSISAGMYLVNPEVTRYIPQGYFDMPNLIQALLDDGKKICHYTCTELWMDLGKIEDLQEANRLLTERGLLSD